MKRIIGLALALSLGFVPGLWAQASTGNILGSYPAASSCPERQAGRFNCLACGSKNTAYWTLGETST
jgi:hypothetical protein